MDKLSHVPLRRVAISGRVNTMGSKNTSPHMVQIGMDHARALGTCTEGSCTSSAILATGKHRIALDFLISKGSLTHANGSVRIGGLDLRSMSSNEDTQRVLTGSSPMKYPHPGVQPEADAS